MSTNYSLNLIQTAAVSTKQVAFIYVYMRPSFYWPLFVLCFFVHMISNQVLAKNHVIC